MKMIKRKRVAGSDETQGVRENRVPFSLTSHEHARGQKAALSLSKGVSAPHGLPRTVRTLHHRWDGDAHHGQSANQFAPDYCNSRQQEMFSSLIGLVQYWVAMIKGVEQLRQLERVLSQISGLSCGDALVDYVGCFRGGEPELPKLVSVFVS